MPDSPRSSPHQDELVAMAVAIVCPSPHGSFSAIVEEMLCLSPDSCSLSPHQAHLVAVVVANFGSSNLKMKAIDSFRHLLCF
ncbi:hypothetical protein K1719_032953 [Acacia pycnantha]|nr:hypothetical protein K1719_032953 [Acacia pycnantha]